MSDQSLPNKQDSIQKLIDSFAEHEPPFSSLGTPFLADTEATQALVEMGSDAIPALVKSLDDSNSKVAMYAAYVLGQMDDPSVLPALRQTKARYEAKEPKEEYDFGVISSAGRAIDRLDELTK